jgi:hypothetical protein
MERKETYSHQEVVEIARKAYEIGQYLVHAVKAKTGCDRAGSRRRIHELQNGLPEKFWDEVYQDLRKHGI